MPCAIISGADYPDYIKSILKNIAVRNDTTLKACACSLRSPVNDEGCPIIDGNGKIGAFPSCTQPPSPYLKIFQGSLEDIMNLYWRVKKFKVTASGNGIINGEPTILFGGGELETKYYDHDGDVTYVTNQEKLVCSPYGERQHYKSGILNFTNPNLRADYLMDLQFYPVFSKLSESSYRMLGKWILSDDGTTLALGGGSFSDPPSFSVGSWSLSLFGATFSGPIGCNPLDPEPTPSGNFSINFTASEYWS